MTHGIIKSNLLLNIIAGIILLFTKQMVFGEILKPGITQIQKEEFALKQKIRPVLLETLQGQFVDLAVTVLYIQQQNPILSNDANIRRYKLPGFEGHINIASKADEIKGYIENFKRYRSFTLLINSPLTVEAETNLQKLLKESADLELGVRDNFNILIVNADAEGITQEEKESKKKQNELDKLFLKLGKDKKERGERLARLFPGLDHPPDQIDPRLEAESSKHLIQSRMSYFKNDLDLALNEVIEAININPYSSKSYEMLGSIYYRLKWHNLALSNWAKALALDPENKKLGKYINLVKNQL
ncbi:MAG: hypothetical protein OEY59_01250 [Deltaproteobacteria bacterium]|nr:hypothetical protein [Deltaproteobacteria bacterium]